MRIVFSLLIGLTISLSTSIAFGQQFKVMVYTTPDRWHDATIPIAMNEFKEMALRHDFNLTWAQRAGNADTENPFTDEYLQNFDAIVFLHSRGYNLSDDQMDSFKRYIRSGGGFVGIHAPAASEDQEEWFHRLIGRVFTDHPKEQTAVINVVDHNFPATMHLPEKWVWTDEWYSFGEEMTDNLNTILTVDESTYDPNRTWGDDTRFTEMGDYHPISWYQEFEGGRSFYTSLGHIPATYKDPWFLAHIYGGIYWAATGLGVSN